MASSSLANFFSLFIPAKAPPPSSSKLAPPPSNLSLSSENKDGILPPLISSGMAPPHSPITLSSSSSSSYSYSYSNCSNDLTSVVCPSLAYANTLYYKQGYNVQLVLDEDEPEESVVQRFRREVMRAGIIQEAKRRRFHESSQEKVKRKTKEAAKRNRRRRTFPPRGDQMETSTHENDDYDDSKDNWDM